MTITILSDELQQNRVIMQYAANCPNERTLDPQSAAKHRFHSFVVGLIKEH